MNTRNCEISQISCNSQISIRQKLDKYQETSQNMENDFQKALILLRQFIQQAQDFNQNQCQNPQDMQNDALDKFNQHNVDIEKHFIHQKSDNQKMYQDLDDLKTSNDKMYQNIYECQKKLEQLETKIGLDFPLNVQLTTN